MPELPNRGATRFPVSIVLRNAEQKRKCKLLFVAVSRSGDHTAPHFRVFHFLVQTLERRKGATIVTLTDRVGSAAPEFLVFTFVAHQRSEKRCFAASLAQPVNSRRPDALIRRSEERSVGKE